MKHLGRRELDGLRAQLRARESQLDAEIEAAQRQDREQDAGELDPGQIDYATALARANLLRDQREIEQLRAALARMDRGTYGRCLSCGAGIPGERLHAEPAAEFCRVCQARTEGG